MDEVTTAAAEFDNDPGIGAIIITGNEKAFAAGADIKEMSDLSFADVFAADFFAPWAKFAAVRTPTIAAVAGYALGGGCELAMMCDVLIAADTAKFGQPEIKLGVLPGMGGSQRLTRAIGKAKAMDLILTGRTIDAEEAERSGLVSRVVPADQLIDEAKAVATTISQDVAVGVADGQGGRQPRVRDHPGRGTALRAPAVPLGVRHRRPDRRHERVHREAPAELHPPLRCLRDRHRRTRRPQKPTSPQTTEPAQEQPEQRPWWLRHYTFIGTAVGLVFVWLSLTPSLLPRGPLFQGLVSGAAGAIGYGIGVFAVWLVRYMRSKDTSPPAPRWAWLALVVVGIIGQILMIIWFHVWQDDVRDLMGVPRLGFWDHPLTAVLAHRHAVRVRRDRPADRQVGALPGPTAQSRCAAAGFGGRGGGAAARADHRAAQRRRRPRSR